MNKYLKQATTLLLVFILVLNMGLSVFASSSDDDDPDPTPGSSVVVEPDDKADKNASSVLTENDTESWLTYVLAVSTGVSSGNDVEYIQIKYFNDSGTLVSQVLDPRGSDHLNNPSSITGSIIGGSSDLWLTFLQNGVLGFAGSKYSTYYPVLQQQGSLSAGNLIAGTSFETWVGELTGGTGFPSLKEKIDNTGNLFDSYTTEYIRFRTEYPLASVYEIDFVMNGIGTQDWSLNGWQLFRTREWSIQKRDGVKSHETPDGKVIYPVVPKYENYGFFSDRNALSFNGELICQSTVVPEEGVGYQFGSDCVRFVTTNGVPSGSGLGTTDLFAPDLPPNVFGLTNDVSQTVSAAPVTLDFSINIADEYAAGIDSFNKTDSSLLELSEMLTATIYYENTLGFKERVSVPVMSSALAEFIAGEKNGNTFTNDPDRFSKALSGSYLSFAQQGDSICFSVEFPNFKSLQSVDLEYINESDENDALIIRDITVYSDESDGNRGHYIASNSEYAIDMEVDRGELLYRTGRNDYEVTLDSATTSYSFTMENGGIVVPVKDYTDKYLVTVTTDDVQSAGTVNDVIMQFDYINTSGKEVSTQEYLLSDACLEFYGYNPGEDASGDLKDASYYIGMKQGGTLKYYITALNCSRFTNVKFHMENASDDWQMGSLTIQALRGASVGKRRIYPENGEYSGLKVNRRYDREVDGEIIYTNSDKKIYLNGDDTVEFDLDGATISDDTTTRDYRDYYYSMDYETASSDLRLDEASKNYEIRVNVAGNASKGTADDGCGSNNLFYFQLVFKNGVSAYVLANQQLESDGFRSGMQECFYISTNEDLGDVVAVNIIPDDVTDDSSKLDKLCIDNIEIIKYNRGSVNKRYVCENVGWINMEYRDSGSSEVQEGRSAAEMMTTASVSSSAYMLTLEVSIAYEEPPREKAIATDEYGNKEEIEVEGTQFVGNLLADITYVNSANETKTIRDVQLVKLMYDYDGKTAVIDEERGFISDPAWMFRPNTIDRFTFSVDDATYIKGFTLKGNPQQNCYLNIADLSISIIRSDGMLNINSNSEYQMSYDIEPAVLVTGVTRKLPEQFYFTANKYTGYSFVFMGNQIEDLDSDSSLETIISRVPESANDSLNVYLYMDDRSSLPSVTGQSPVTSIYYSSVNTGSTYLTRTQKYKETTVGGTNVLYATGLSATNMSLLTNMTITADPECTNCLIDHAIVQQVRNGVVINTYRIDFTGRNPAVRLGISMSSKTSAAIGSTQTLRLLLGENTPGSKLVSEDYDIAAAIRYRSAAGDTDEIFTSPYVFLTDSGCHSVKKGTLAEFVFNEASVREIVGIYVVGVNGLKAEVESAVLETVEHDGSGNPVTTGYYSFDESFELTPSVSAESMRKVTSTGAGEINSLLLTSFSFTTAEDSMFTDSNGSAPVRMTVVYTDADGAAASRTIEDIRTLLRSGGFGPGETAEISFYLKGAAKLNYIELEPYDQDETGLASWNLESVSAIIYGAEDQTIIKVSVDDVIRERGEGMSPARINLSNLVARVKVSKNNGIGKDQGTVDNGVIEFEAAGGDEFSLIPTMMGGLDGYAYLYKVDKVISENTGDERSETVIGELLTDEASQLFTVPANNTGGTVVYRITVSSEENPAANSTVVIRVAPPAGPDETSGE